MQYLSSKKCLSIAVTDLILFLAAVALCALTAFAVGDKFTMIVGFVGVATVAVLGLPSAYYFYMYMRYKTQMNGASVSVGVITNWNKSMFHRSTASVSMKINGAECSTPAYFSAEEAHAMVGRTVKYAIIENTLFIYDEVR